MAKKKSQNWRRVDLDLWRKFKSRCAVLGIKIYDAQTEAIELFLAKRRDK